MTKDAPFRTYALSLTVQQKDIYYISWNVDAAEGLGLLQTDDAAAGKITIFTTGSMLEDLLAMVGGLKAEGVAITLNEIIEMEKTTNI